MLFSFSLIFCQFHPGVACKSVAYKKKRVSEKLCMQFFQFCFDCELINGKTITAPSFYDRISARSIGTQCVLFNRNSVYFQIEQSEKGTHTNKRMVL